MRRIGFGALAGFVLFAMAGVAMAQGGMIKDYKGTETPAYTVEAREGAVELRAYPPHLAAEVTVQGSRDAAVGTGFRVLAAYIFGGNEAEAKVAMTTPVAQSEKIAMTTPVAQSGAGSTWVVQFSMPSEFTMETLPRPKDPRIRIVTNPAKRMVVLEFSGIPTTSALEARSAELRDWVAKRGFAVEEPPQFLFYDSPFTLPWKRRNEVGFVLR
jgi:hypothetical protein